MAPTKRTECKTRLVAKLKKKANNEDKIAYLTAKCTEVEDMNF